MNADGVTHVGPTTVISHAFDVQTADCGSLANLINGSLNCGEDEVAITEFGGSFGISLYSAAEHLTRMAASGCVH